MLIMMPPILEHLVAVAILVPAACAFMDGTEQPAPGTGAGTDMTIVKLDGAATGAVCLDGTNPAYYIRPGFGSGVGKWRIHHQGGGWCEGYPDCVARSKTDLGSSAAYPASINETSDYYSINPVTNPLFWNWK